MFSEDDLEVLSTLALAASGEVALRQTVERAEALAGVAEQANRRLHTQALASDLLGASLRGQDVLSALAGPAVALNAAAGAADSNRGAGRVANTGWDRWTPVNAAAIGMHLAGSVGQLIGNRKRLTTQQGVGTMSAVKTALTVGALAATGYARVLGRKVSRQGPVPAEDGTTPSESTPQDVAAAQRQLTALQWAIPALTGALVVVSAFAGEQQRPASVLAGLRERLTPRPPAARAKVAGARRASAAVDHTFAPRSAEPRMTPRGQPSGSTSSGMGRSGRQQFAEIQSFIFVYAGLSAALPATGAPSRSPAPSDCAAASRRVWNCWYWVHAAAIGVGGTRSFMTASVSCA